MIYWFSLFLATVVTTITSGGPTFDFTVTGSNSYRPLTFTEKVFTDEWAKKIPTTTANNNTNTNHSKEPIITNQHHPGLYFHQTSKTNHKGKKNLSLINS